MQCLPHCGLTLVRVLGPTPALGFHSRISSYFGYRCAGCVSSELGQKAFWAGAPKCPPAEGWAMEFKVLDALRTNMHCAHIKGPDWVTQVRHLDPGVKTMAAVTCETMMFHRSPLKLEQASPAGVGQRSAGGFTQVQGGVRWGEVRQSTPRQ